MKVFIQVLIGLSNLFESIQYLLSMIDIILQNSQISILVWCVSVILLGPHLLVNTNAANLKNLDSVKSVLVVLLDPHLFSEDNLSVFNVR